MRGYCDGPGRLEQGGLSLWLALRRSLRHSCPRLRERRPITPESVRRVLERYLDWRETRHALLQSDLLSGVLLAAPEDLGAGGGEAAPLLV